MNSLVIITLLGFVCGSLAQSSSCRNSFGSYLQCLKIQMSGQNYNILENELREHYKARARQCFNTQYDPNASTGKCFLTDQELNAHICNLAPIRACGKCHGMCNFLISKFQNLPAENGKCIRDTISQAVSREIGACLRQTRPGFILPAIPDFDQPLEVRSNLMNFINTLNIFVNVNWKAEVCNLNSRRNNDRKWSNTIQCMAQKPVGHMQQHCLAAGQCKNNVASTCNFQAVEVDTCRCMARMKNDIKAKIRQIRDYARSAMPTGVRRFKRQFPFQLPGSSSLGSGSAPAKAKKCEDDIKGALNSGVVNWRVEANKLIRCTGIGGKINVDLLIGLGCQRAASAGPEGVRILGTAFRLVNAFVDALISRVERFCPTSHYPCGA